MFSRDRAAWLGVAASVMLHLALALVLVRLPAPGVTGAELAGYEVRFSLDGEAQPGETPDDAHGRSPAEPAPPEPGGQRSAQNIDASDPGQGGDATGAVRGILLFHEADTITLQDSPLNALGQMQTQRIYTARDRATRDQRRATPNPHDQPFLASGEGHHPERRPVARSDAAQGARVAPEPSRRGSDTAEPSSDTARRSVAADGEPLGSPPRPRSTHATGTTADSPGRGILRGRGARRTESARVAHGRPPVDQGPAATPGESYDPRIRDDSDAELLAARMEQSWVEATRREGRRGGTGAGGVGGDGAPGSGGGTREGGRASAFGPGSGDHAALDTSDRRYVQWLIQQTRRVFEELDFPRERQIAMDQGTTVCRVSVRRDGSFAREPSMVRSSGFGDLDHAALAAIRQAAPFAPIPDGLAPRAEVLHVTMPIRFHNPMVGR